MPAFASEDFLQTVATASIGDTYLFEFSVPFGGGRAILTSEERACSVSIFCEFRRQFGKGGFGHPPRDGSAGWAP